MRRIVRYAPVSEASGSLDSFLSRLGEPTPAPAGGSALALTAAAAAALIEMVSGIGARNGSERLRAAAASARRLRADLLGAVTEDADAYQAVVRARSSRRPDEVERTMRQATLVPLAIAEKSADLVRLGAEILDEIRATTVPDLAGALSLLGAAIQGAVLTVRVNLRDVTDARFVADVEDRMRAAAAAVSISMSTFERAVTRLGLGATAP
jgi:formiminotetrahydrofolate cyclodeaminase